MERMPSLSGLLILVPLGGLDSPSTVAFQTNLFRYAKLVDFTTFGLPFVLIPHALFTINNPINPNTRLDSTSPPNHLIRIMKQTLGLIIAALASAASVSAQTPSYQGALVISRMSLPFHHPPPAALFYLL